MLLRRDLFLSVLNSQTTHLISPLSPSSVHCMLAINLPATVLCLRAVPFVSIGRGSCGRKPTVCFRFHFHQQVKLLQSLCLCVSPWMLLIKSAFQKKILMVKVLAMEARFDRPSLHIDPILVFFSK